MACPVGALKEKDNTAEGLGRHRRSDKARGGAARARRARCAGRGVRHAHGHLVTGKMAARSSPLGFDKVFDTDYGADLTIMEEATELIDRVKNGGVLPMITSC